MSCFTSLWRCPEVGLPVSRCPEKTGLPDLGGKNDHACTPLVFPSTLLFFVELPFSSKRHPEIERKRLFAITSSSLNFRDDSCLSMLCSKESAARSSLRGITVC